MRSVLKEEKRESLLLLIKTTSAYSFLYIRMPTELIRKIARHRGGSGGRSCCRERSRLVMVMVGMMMMMRMRGIRVGGRWNHSGCCCRIEPIVHNRGCCNISGRRSTERIVGIEARRAWIANRRRCRSRHVSGCCC